MVFMESLFQVRSLSMSHVSCQDMIFDDFNLILYFFRRKRWERRRAIILRYSRSPTRTRENPIDIAQQWQSAQPYPTSTSPLSLSHSLQRVLALLHVAPLANYHYSAETLRIDGYNKLLVLGFSKEWIMKRLDWTTEAILRVYYDSRIMGTDDSRWFFALLL